MKTLVTVPFVLPTAVPREPLVRFRVYLDGPRSVLRLTGELDLASGPLLVEVVDRQIGRGLIDLTIDLSGLVFCDLRGLYALREAHQNLAAAGGHPSLLNPCALLLMMAQLCKFEALFEGVPT